ncbi:unnamed protein product [Callosobruchus maculatus]|uniref:Uncharacterized protein n=1 Tax=Callosobruchus maculatus TaxID=64391 RepID=A0A653DMY1_CALMS|nr:unnamed protein product [Callosobruchus maculatus]
MSRWLKLLLFSALLGYAKAHHFIRVVILAALGLAGLWMVHTLAQDFTTIQANRNNNLGLENGEREVFKRSVDDPKATPLPHAQIDWNKVLQRDPVSCARSFMCQLAATHKESLTRDEKKMLELVRYSVKLDSWASRQLEEALKNGEQLRKPSRCMKIYRFCPYSSQMMMTLLRLFAK